jgi:anti-sigma factor RsiW
MLCTSDSVREILLMGCRLFERELDAYFDGELNAESTTAVREHLDKCADCRGRLADRAALASLVRAAPSYASPDHLRARVLAEVRSRSVSRTIAC